MFSRALIFSRLDRDDAVKLAEKLASTLQSRGVKTYFEHALASRLGVRGVEPSRVEVDLAVVVGGDGTVLRVIHQLNREVPLFTVSMGKVGFFGEVEPSEAQSFLAEVLSGRFIQDKCFMVEVDVEGFPPALNEIKIGNENPQRMVDLSVYVDGSKVAQDRLDAVLVSTPSGASAYSLSAGACLVDPRLEVFLIVPVCPLSANFKPFIVPSNVKVSIKPEGEAGLLLLADGVVSKRVYPPRTIEIRRSERFVVFLRRGFTFYERVKRRLRLSSV
ncbi:MAG: NAD(+)/NADH kinase [Candidatus Hecatellaceae archaeon]